MSTPTHLAEYCQCWGFSANHLLVNHERNIYRCGVLQRCRSLDQAAQRMAQNAVSKGNIAAAKTAAQCTELQNTLKSQKVSQVILVGNSIQEIHTSAMKHNRAARRTILTPKHKEFGMATARYPGDSNKIVIVQLFRG